MHNQYMKKTWWSKLLGNDMDPSVNITVIRSYQSIRKIKTEPEPDV